VRASVLDIGSNSVQMLAAAIDGGTWRELAAAERITRLAEGLSANRTLAPTACARTLAAIEALAGQARAVGARHVWAVGTRAFRLAVDGPAFASRVERVIGEPVEILSAAREAELGFAGAVLGLGCTRGPVLSVDIGGGSTEIVSGYDAEPHDHVSLPLGAVVLTDRYLRHDPPSPEEVSALRSAVGEAVGGVLPLHRHRDAGEARGPVICSGGTVTTLAAMRARLDRYRADVVHGSHLERETLRAVSADLAARSIAERCTLPGLHPARAPTILAGALILDELFHAAGADVVLVSDHGLRHAVLRERARGFAG
jgi:exopolyphosphatase/guanosine-5'-triphosphate,3'-diphosphate pyrophosphatase